MVFCQTERKNPLATLVFVEVILSQRRDWEFGVVLSFLAALNTPIHGDIHQFFHFVVEKAVSFFGVNPQLDWIHPFNSSRRSDDVQDSHCHPSKSTSCEESEPPGFWRHHSSFLQENLQRIGWTGWMHRPAFSMNCFTYRVWTGLTFLEVIQEARCSCFRRPLTKDAFFCSPLVEKYFDTILDFGFPRPDIATCRKWMKIW